MEDEWEMPIKEAVAMVQAREDEVEETCGRELGVDWLGLGSCLGVGAVRKGGAG